MCTFLFCVLLSLVSCVFQQEDLPSPVTTFLPIVVANNASCPSAKEIKATIVSEVLTHYHFSRSNWRRIAHLDMRDPSQRCPTNLRSITTPVRACGQANSSVLACDSVLFQTNNEPYSRVYGRVHAYLKGSTLGFWNYNFANQQTLDGPYLDGVSLTHGAAGSREHIWSFVASGVFSIPAYDCPCSFTNRNHGTWRYQVPPFVGNEYFCETAYEGRSKDTYYYLDDRLWDGKECGTATACCRFNSPPWFHTTLPQKTTDDIELRLCNYYGGTAAYSAGDLFIDLVEIYVQ